MPTSDTRAKSILFWLKHTLNLDIKQFEPASSDASFRRYFRVIHSQGQHIVMDAPPEKEDIEPFIRIATLLKKSGVNVPTIFQQDLDQGFLLLEDFGPICFLDQLNANSADEIYQSAFNSLLTLQSKVSIKDCQLPFYNDMLLNQELSLFYEWFLSKQLKISIPKNIKFNLNQQLVASALEQPQVCVHRDFHSRNLMLLNDNSPGVIDFQDAVIGPITYDLVSLLRDCYISWPDDKIQRWISVFLKQITQQGLTTVSIETFTRWFDLMGLQRHLKVLGIFTRLNLRDNKANYLKDIPLTLDYVCQICNKYSELEEFNQYLTNTILPAYNKQQ